MNAPHQSDTHLTFLGAAGTVTGSRYLLEAGGRRVLVDCGLFQGYKTLRMRNWEPLPVSAGGIDAVVLTHAHLDHSGYLPRLVREGFRGRATRALCEVLLPDSGHLQEEDAASANRHGYSKHKPAQPLYTRVEAVPFGETFQPAPGLHARLAPQGHILGAASARFEAAGMPAARSAAVMAGRFRFHAGGLRRDRAAAGGAGSGTPLQQRGARQGRVAGQSG